MNGNSPSGVTVALFKAVGPSWKVGRDPQDASVPVDGSVSKHSVEIPNAFPPSSEPSTLESSLAVEKGYLHRKFFALHREQEGCSKVQRALLVTHWEHDFCRGGVGCFRRQRLTWRFHEASTASSQPNPDKEIGNTTLLEVLSAR